MTGRLAILAGSGVLPVALFSTHPEAVKVGFQGVPNGFGPDAKLFFFEKLGELFAHLHDIGVSRVVFAGSMSRPPLAPERFDSVMRDLAPRLIAAMQGGDDSLLRLVIEIFEEQGFEVIGAHELLAGLTCGEGHWAGPAPSADSLRDAERAADIVLALAPVDVGQGAVVEGGICLGIETIQGTDAMLAVVAQTQQNLRGRTGGVLLKAAKRGQDLRIDMPAIGPDTVAEIAAAGLSGVVIEAGKVMILEREKTLQAFESAGIFLIARVL